MAPTWPGEHFKIYCDDCQFGFIMDADNVPRSEFAVCPNCGYSKTSFKANLVVQPPKAKILTDAIVDRWDLVAFQQSKNLDGNNEMIIKRVVGLPGEQIEIKNGNVVVNGQAVVKPDAIFDATKISVFNSMHQPKTMSIKRWNSVFEHSGWVNVNREWQFHNNAERKQTDWLIYNHIRGYRHAGLREKRFPIEDSYAYNQNLARQLRPISELSFHVAAQFSLASELVMQIQMPRCIGTATISKTKALLEIKNSDGTVTKTKSGKSRLEMPVSQIKLSSIDGVLSLAIDSNNVAKIELPTSVNGPVEIRIGAKAGDLSVKHIQIFRDIYYLNSSTRQTQPFSKINLQDDEYFLLGDNIPISNDSRSFGPIKGKQILGTVLSKHETNLN